MKALVEAQLYRDAGNVTRYHAKRTIRRQNIAEHTFGILMLVKQVKPDLSLNLVNAILHHDLPELFTGDVPAPIKRAHPDLGPLLDHIEEGLAPLYNPVMDKLTPNEITLLKWADRMELVLWCLEEVRMGNSYCETTVRRGLGWILNVRVPDCAKQLTSEVAADALSVGIVPATGEELERNA